MEISPKKTGYCFFLPSQLNRIFCYLLFINIFFSLNGIAIDKAYKISYPGFLSTLQFANHFIRRSLLIITENIYSNDADGKL